MSGEDQDKTPAPAEEPVMWQGRALTPYTVIIPAAQDWTDETIYSFMCMDIAQRNTLPLSQQRFDGLVGAQIYGLQEKREPIISPPIADGASRPRGEFQTSDGKTVMGYEMVITPKMQQDFLSRAEQELKNPPPPAELSEAYKANLSNMDKEAAELQAKWAALDKWYQSKNTRHGLDGYTDFYLERADGYALALQNARNDAKNPNLLNSETRLGSALAYSNARMDELFGDHRNVTPEELVKRLNDRYEAGFEQAKLTADLVGKIPGPVGSIGEFSINQLSNGLRLASGDITPQRAFLEFTKDGTKAVVSLAVKSESGDKVVDKVADFLGDTAVNVSKRLAEVDKTLKDNPTYDRQELVRNAVLHGVGDATVNAFGKNLKLKEMGFSAGADAVKEFGVSLTKNMVEGYRDANRKISADGNIDASQLYKETAVKALINATSDTVGKSLKGLGGDAKQREFLIEVGTKLGIEEPLKQYLDGQKSLADPKKPEDAPKPAPSPQQRSELRTTQTGPLLNEPTHPKNGAFQAMVTSMEQIDRSQNRSSDVRTVQAAATLTSAAVKAGFDPDRAALSTDAQNLFAMKGPAGPEAPRVAVPTTLAMNQSLETSTREVNQAIEQQSRDSQAQVQQEQRRSVLT